MNIAGNVLYLLIQKEEKTHLFLLPLLSSILLFIFLLVLVFFIQSLFFSGNVFAHPVPCLFCSPFLRKYGSSGTQSRLNIFWIKLPLRTRSIKTVLNPELDSKWIFSWWKHTYLPSTPENRCIISKLLDFTLTVVKTNNSSGSRNGEWDFWCFFVNREQEPETELFSGDVNTILIVIRGLWQT